MSDFKAKEKASSDKLDRIEERLDKNAILIAENAKGIAEMKKTTAKMYEALQWVPLKTGLWTVGILLSMLAAIATIPNIPAFVMRLLNIG